MDQPSDESGPKKTTREALGKAPRVAQVSDVPEERSIESILPTRAVDCQAPLAANDRSTEAIAAECFLALQGFCRSLGELLTRLALPDRGVFTLPAKLVAIESLRPVCQHPHKPTSERTRSGHLKRGCCCALAIKSLLRALVQHERDDGASYASSQQLAATAGVYPATVKNWVPISETAGYVTVQQREAQTNRITINWERILRETRNDLVKRLTPGGQP